jgi:FkbM family methyltransferase
MVNKIKQTVKTLLHPRKALYESRLRQSGISPRDYYTYNLPWLLARQFSVVVDIGAARGTHTLLFHRLFPQARIIAFEPLPESFAELRRRTEEIPGIECINCALSDQEGMADFHLGGTGYANSSSLLKMGQAHRDLWPRSGTDACVKVETRCLDSLFHVAEHERIFVKMDVQGGELMVINGGVKLFAAVDTLVVEASMRSLYDGDSTFHELYEKLHGLGFNYAGILEQAFCPSGNGEVIQNDVIFRRKVGNP